MPYSIKRRETTHIDEVTRTATSTVQWLLENRNLRGHATHPITHNNKLTVFMCGEEGFADIAGQIGLAQGSIDLCCWGFDPGMELVRGNGANWPRGATYGDLLIAAGKRGVAVRLLVWYDAIGSVGARNMPGHTHGRWPWLCAGGERHASMINAPRSLAMLQDYCRDPVSLKQTYREQECHVLPEVFQFRPRNMPMLAREEYCYSWYQAAFDGLLSGIALRTRGADAGDIAASLATEEQQPQELKQAGLERSGMVHMGTHHQKPVLIDFAVDEGSKAVGYVMGLNSITDYWDSTTHLPDDARREQGGQDEVAEGMRDQAGTGFRSLKPYHDYACRIDGGKALIALYNNFVIAWDRAIDDRTHAAANACVSRELACGNPPAALLRPAQAGDSTVQIVRTQPEQQDKTVKEAYWQATDTATLAARYLYIENQYFQYEEWARRLLKVRQNVIALWSRACASVGKGMRDMPVMHVLIVIPVPEKAGMIPRTYDTLATLGQQDGMTGQTQLIKDINQRSQQLGGDGFGGAPHPVPPPDVVRHANSINKPDAMTLENSFGLKICTAMLNTCDCDVHQWRYREVYIHSKLMLVDDVFLTLGSANLNQRSMAVDSELNLSSIDPAVASALRRRIWHQHSGGLIDGGSMGKDEMASAFKKWSDLRHDNLKKKNDMSSSAYHKKMTGFLLPLEDRRSSIMRLG